MVHMNLMLQQCCFWNGFHGGTIHDAWRRGRRAAFLNYGFFAAQIVPGIAYRLVKIGLRFFFRHTYFRIIKLWDVS